MPAAAAVQSPGTPSGRSHQHDADEYCDMSLERSPNTDDRRHNIDEALSTSTRRSHSADDIISCSPLEAVSDGRSRAMDMGETHRGSTIFVDRPRISVLPSPPTSHAAGRRSFERESVFPELKYSLPSAVSRSPVSVERHRVATEYPPHDPGYFNSYYSASSAAKISDPPSSNGVSSMVRHLPVATDAIFNRDTITFSGGSSRVEDGRFGGSMKSLNALAAGGDYTSFADKFKTDFRFLEAFAERSKSHPFNSENTSKTPDRKRKSAQYNSHEDERRQTSTRFQSNRRDFDKPEIDFSAVAAAASAVVCQSNFRSAASDWFASSSSARDHEEVDPMSALLRRYGASGELLSMASSSTSARGSLLFPISSSSMRVSTSPSRRVTEVPPPIPVPPPPTTSYRPTLEQRSGYDMLETMMQTPEILQHHRQQQQPAAVDAVDDSSHDNTNFGGDVGGESIISGSGSNSMDESKGQSRDRDDVIDEGGQKNYYCHMCSYVGEL